MKNQQLTKPQKLARFYNCAICGTKVNGKRVKVAKGEFNCTSCQLVMFNGKPRGVYA